MVDNAFVNHSWPPGIDNLVDNAFAFCLLQFGGLLFTLLDLSRSSTRNSIRNCLHPKEQEQTRSGPINDAPQIELGVGLRSSRVSELFLKEINLQMIFQSIHPEVEIR